MDARFIVRRTLAAAPALLALALPPPAASCPLADRNAEGVARLQARDAAAAIELLEAAALDPDGVAGCEGFDDAARARVLFNLGAAYELAGRTADALKVYSRSVRLDPGYERPRKRYEAVALELPRGSYGGYGRILVEALIDEGAFERAEQYLEAALKGATDRAARPFVAPDDLPRALARLLIARQVGPEEFRRRWLDLLPEPGSSALGPEVERRLARIAWAYTGEVPMVRSEQEAHRALGGWTADSKTFTDLLRTIADAYQRAGDAAAAAPHYALAWAGSGDYDAAAYLGGLLLEHRETLDPDGTILRSLVDGLFEGKRDAYASEDWQAIARYHTLLAEIYTRNGRWGDLDDPYSAVFQWENAIRAHRRLSGSSPAPIPRLHAALAHCYQEKSDEEKAAENYLTAAEQFLVQGRAAEAETMVYRTRQLPAERIDAHNLQRLEAVRGAVSDAKRGAAGGTATVGEASSLQRTLAADPALLGATLYVVREPGEGKVRLEGTVEDVRQLEEAKRLLEATGEASVVIDEVEVGKIRAQREPG